MARTSEARRMHLPALQPALYERDAYAWALEQACLIRERRFAEIDLENVAEEIESVGRSERAAFRSQLGRVIQHLLKWDYQPLKRTPSWRHSVAAHRVRAHKILSENPSFKAIRDDIVSDAFDVAVLDAVAETGLERAAFPDACPYSFDDIMTRLLDDRSDG